jgi:acyl-ACP thioesterase
MEAVYKTSEYIRAFDVDANNRLKVSTLFDYFQDAASKHAEHLNVGFTDLIPKGLLWVLSWVKMEVINYPKFLDQVKIQTWGKSQHKLYSMRDFLLFNSNDEVLCKGTTAWLLLDSKTLRPKILTQIFPDVMLNGEKSALDEYPIKINNIGSKEIVFSKKINYTDIDLNKHVNNAKYVEYILDCYDQDFHKDHIIKSLTISFLTETKFNHELELYKSSLTIENGYDYIEAKNLITDKDVFKATIEWR